MVALPQNIIVCDETNGVQSPATGMNKTLSLSYYTMDMTPDGRIIFGACGGVPDDGLGRSGYYFIKQLVTGVIELDTDFSTAIYIGEPEPGYMSDGSEYCRVVAVTDNIFRFYYNDRSAGAGNWREVYVISFDGGATWSAPKFARPLTAFNVPAALTPSYTEGNTKRWVNHRRGQITGRNFKYYYRQLTN
jgi:hypothetical protein